MTETASLKMLSYNIHKGFSTGNRRYVLGKIRQAIQSVHADLVFLQEVLGDHKGHSERIEAWPDEPQFEYLADTIWSHFAYGKNAVYQKGHHGNAILSKYPFTAHENIDISTNRLEKRGLLHGVIEVPGQTEGLHVICLHLNLLKRGRMRQIERLAQRIDAEVPADAPLIIAGDFNDWRVDLSQHLITRLQVKEAHFDIHDKHARTFPSWMPILKLDRVYYRGFRTLAAKTLTGEPWRTLSDHAALYTELVFEGS